MRISDWSSDVCSSDLEAAPTGLRGQGFSAGVSGAAGAGVAAGSGAGVAGAADGSAAAEVTTGSGLAATCGPNPKVSSLRVETIMRTMLVGLSEDHTSELQSPMRIPYAVLFLRKHTNKHNHNKHLI